MKPPLLVVELWRLGDLVIATPFLRAAAEKFDVTLLARPYASELQALFWPEVKVVPFVAPWTAFKGKYRLAHWPWRRMLSIRRELRTRNFEVGVSARWDPRDHLLLAAAGARKRLGYARMGSRFWLTQSMERPDPKAHRSEHWRALARPLGLEIPEQLAGAAAKRRTGTDIVVHTGAGEPIRVWALERYAKLVAHLRSRGYRVRVLCDANQRDWWRHAGESDVASPETAPALLAFIEGAAALIGNDSGPGHLAAFAGVPTFTIFGPQLPEWFAPQHPASEWVEGKPCPYKPCADYCRFDHPLCMTRLSAPEVQAAIDSFLKRIEHH